MSVDKAPKSTQSEPRRVRAIAFLSPAGFALLGALVGAFSSLVGVYLTSERQGALDELATKRDAYAAFLSKAAEYSRQMAVVQFAYTDDDPHASAEFDRRKHLDW